MDPRAQTFLVLLNPHRRRLSAVARQYAAGPDDAAELVQETLLRAWRFFSANPQTVVCRAWLVVILRRIAAEWHRTAQRRIRLAPADRVELTEPAAPDPGEPFPALPAMDEERFREFLDDRVVAALEALEPLYREVVVLSVAGGLYYREIAETLDCPVGTVMSRMARARRGLRDRLSQYASAQVRIRGGAA